MRIKIRLSACKNKQSEIEITVREAGMVEPVEARGHKSICTLLDVQDFDTARVRLEELGIKIRHQKNKPIVNIEEVKAASRKWHKSAGKK